MQYAVIKYIEGGIEEDEAPRLIAIGDDRSDAQDSVELFAEQVGAKGKEHCVYRDYERDIEIWQVVGPLHVVVQPITPNHYIEVVG